MSPAMEAVTEAAPATGFDPILSFLFTVFCIGLFVFWLRQRANSNSDLFEDALNNAGRGIAILDSQNKILFWNKWLEKSFGMPASLTMNCRLNEIKPFFPDPAIGKTITELIGSPTQTFPATIRTTLQKPDSSESFPVILSFFPFTSQRSEKPLFVVTISEVSQAEEHGKRIQEALNKAETDVRKMTEVDHLKSEFLTICSHELKTPLVSITGYLDLITSEKFGPITAKQRNALSICLRNSSRLNGIISSLLDFARMEAGKLQFEFNPHRFSSLIEEVLGVVLPMANAKQIRLSQDLEPELPLVFIDAGLMHRVLLNLLDNAIKFTEASGEIMIKAWHANDHVVVEVSDTGQGIPESKIGRIAEPFFQGDASDTRKSGGLGLGLAIVEKILLGHSTKMEMDSLPGKGTKIRFRLKKAFKTNSGRFVAFSGDQKPLSPASSPVEKP